MKNSWPNVFVGQSVSQSVSQYVCPSVFGNSARTAGPIGPGVAPFDVPKRRNDDGACHESIGGTWHMAHGTCRRVKACNNFRTALQVKRWGPLISNLQVTRRLS